MTGDIRTDQRGSTVGGHQAGRDLFVNEVQSRPTLMTTLIKRYKEEITQNPDFQHFIESLHHYTVQLPGDAVQGLRPKMEKANRHDAIPQAEQLKEIFSKKLMRLRFSESAQHILSYILGRLYSLFHLHVAPMIAQRCQTEAVDAKIHEILSITFSELDENVLLINFQELLGMVYYLLGNCHLRLHAK